MLTLFGDKKSMATHLRAKFAWSEVDSPFDLRTQPAGKGFTLPCRATASASEGRGEVSGSESFPLSVISLFTLSLES